MPLLRSLCCGVSEAEMPAAVSGLLAGSAAVRACALGGLVNVPTLAEGVAPESSGVTAVLALDRHDAPLASDVERHRQVAHGEEATRSASGHPAARPWARPETRRTRRRSTSTS